jgi:hypothetical protein
MIKAMIFSRNGWVEISIFTMERKFRCIEIRNKPHSCIS